MFAEESTLPRNCSDCGTQIKYGRICFECHVKRCGHPNTLMLNTVDVDKIKKDSPENDRLKSIPIVASEMMPAGSFVMFQQDIMKALAKSLGVTSHMFWGECNCPFDLFAEFDQWIEWRRRVYLEKEPSGMVTGSMTDWDEEVYDRCRITNYMRFRAHQDFGIMPTATMGIIHV